MRFYYLAIVVLLLILSANAQDNLKQGFLCLQEKQFEEARFYFEHVLKQIPDHLDAGLGLAQAYIGMTRFDYAETTLLQMLEYHPTNPRIHLGLGQVYLAQQKFDESIVELEEARRQLQDSSKLDVLLAVAHLGKGVLTYQKKQKRQAISEFRESIRLDSTNVKSYQNLALALIDIKKEEEAWTVVENGLRQDPINRELLLVESQLLLKRKEFGHLVETLNALYVTNPDDADIGLKLAYFLRFQNRGEEAVEIYQELYRKFPTQKRIIDEWANYLVARKEYDNARALYTRLLEKYQDKAKIHDAIADIYLKENNYQEARKEFKKILTASPGDIPTLKKIAQTFETEDNPLAACAQYELALKCAHSKLDSADLYREIGRVYEDADSLKAISAYEQMIQVIPELDYPNIRLGLLHQQAGSNTMAMRYFQRAVELSSTDPIPYYRLAKHTLSLGDTVRAKELTVAAVRKGLQQRSKARSQILGQLKDTNGQMSISEFESIGAISQTVEFSLPTLHGALKLLLRLIPDWQRGQVLQDLWDEFRYDTVIPEYLGKVLEAEGFLDDALSVYKKLLKNNVRSKTAHAGLARIYEKKSQLYDAILEYKRTIDIDDQDSTAYEALIRLNDQTGNTEDLIKDWQLKGKVNPRNVTLLRYLSDLLEKQGNVEEAKKLMKRIDELISQENM